MEFQLLRKSKLRGIYSLSLVVVRRSYIEVLVFDEVEVLLLIYLTSLSIEDYSFLSMIKYKSKISLCIFV
jgi:hypothetical protein